MKHLLSAAITLYLYIWVIIVLSYVDLGDIEFFIWILTVLSVTGMAISLPEFLDKKGNKK